MSNELTIAEYLAVNALTADYVIAYSDDAPRLPYRHNIYNTGSYPFRYAIHRGQCKLAISEINAITIAMRRNINLKYVVYAGAAAGTHIEILAVMFPQLEFFLYDTNKFTIANVEKYKIRLFHESFTDEIASTYVDRRNDLIFLSDIRTGNVCDPGFEQCIANDMAAQQQWYRIINPFATLLKFRLPYTNGSDDIAVEYLDGTIYTQPYAGNTSTEGRLFAWQDTGTRVYSAIMYEEFFYHHNEIVREWGWYLTAETYNICKCYDCARTTQIFQAYIDTMGAYYTVKEYIKMLECITRQSFTAVAHNKIDAPIGVRRGFIAKKYSADYKRSKRFTDPE